VEEFLGLDKKPTWGDCLTATTRSEFFELIRERFPRDYVLQHQRIEYFADKHYGKEKQPKEYSSKYTNFENEPMELVGWRLANLK